jgi:hypothetical protein
LKPKRIICIILFALLFLTAFPSCGEKDKESETNTVNAFKEKLIKLPDNYSIGPGNSNLAVYGDRVFADIEKIFKK